MSLHHNILVAIDLSNETKKVVQKALELAELYKSKLYMIHVIEPVAVTSPYELTPGLPDDMLAIQVKRAESFLALLAEDLKKPDIPRTVSTGSIKQKIFEAVSDHKIDLIVIGTHGRHGIGLLLGSTASSVLHGTPCDVYAVKI